MLVTVRWLTLSTAASAPGSFSWGPSGCATSVWTGVPLWRLLHACGITEPTPSAQYVCFRGPTKELPKGDDGSYGTSIPMHMALDPGADVLLAYEQNGARLTPDHGFPLRIIIPGWIGGRMVKWLSEISVSATPSSNFYHFNDNRILPPEVDAERAAAEGWWYKPDYIFNELNINSVIGTPAHGEVLQVQRGAAAQPYTLRGYAYTGGGRALTRDARAQRRAFITARPWARSDFRSSTSSSPTCRRIIWPPKSPLVAVRVRNPVLGRARLS